MTQRTLCWNGFTCIMFYFIVLSTSAPVLYMTLRGARLQLIYFFFSVVHICILYLSIRRFFVGSFVVIFFPSIFSINLICCPVALCGDVDAADWGVFLSLLSVWAWTQFCVTLSVLWSVEKINNKDLKETTCSRSVITMLLAHSERIFTLF